MDTIKIGLYISQAVALAGGVARAGITSITPTDEQIASLSPEQRAALVHCVYTYEEKARDALSLDAPTVDWPTTLRAIDGKVAQCRQRAAEEAVRAARDAAANEAEIVKILATPDEDWIQRDYSRGDHRFEIKPWLFRFANDQRIGARMDAVRALRDRREAEALAAATAVKERVAQAEAELEASKEAAIAQLRAYAAETDDLARAATEGYAIEVAAVDRIVAEIAAVSDDAQTLVQESPQYVAAEWEERSAPRAAAFVALDRVTKHVASIRRPPCVEIEVLRVMRYHEPLESETGDGYETGSPITAIVVVVSTPVTKDRVVVVPGEE